MAKVAAAHTSDIAGGISVPDELTRCEGCLHKLADALEARCR
ncbi:protein of unknown function (plasmid) [Methylocella tundrae]|uniref:Uncharacterized protein n=1 Tax=Methylocella tundrae TaxID=227605 RepID=A0A4U8Z7I2_METTU|nr:protein of unknown function [Methylocella tundrae]